MASLSSTRVVRGIGRLPSRQLLVSPSFGPTCLRQCRPYSDAAEQTPPLLSKLKTDLKAAMRAKDALRLGALRSILSATTNAAKTSSPIRTDVQLVALLRKTARGNKDAADEARDAGRQDIVDKEEAQMRILEEYAAESGVQSLGEADLRGIIDAVKEDVTADDIVGKAAIGEILKRLNAPGGPLDGKDVDRKLVQSLVQELSRS